MEVDRIAVAMTEALAVEVDRSSSCNDRSTGSGNSDRSSSCNDRSTGSGNSIKVAVANAADVVIGKEKGKAIAIAEERSYIYLN